MLTSKQRAFLRSKAIAIDTTFQIGKGGVNENMLIAIEAALTAHEMVKIKCLENCEYDAKEASAGISEAIGAEGVQVIGNKFVLFKISPENRQYDLEKLCMIAEKAEKKKKKKPAARSAGSGRSQGTVAKRSSASQKTKGRSFSEKERRQGQKTDSSSGRYTLTKGRK